jgi:hypothetical protein
MIMFRTLSAYQLIAVAVSLNAILISDAQPELKLVNVVSGTELLKIKIIFQILN